VFYKIVVSIDIRYSQANDMFLFAWLFGCLCLFGVGTLTATIIPKKQLMLAIPFKIQNIVTPSPFALMIMDVMVAFLPALYLSG
jgi:hypothetical protein